MFFAQGRREEALETLEHARALSVQAHQPAYVAYCDRLLAGAWVDPADKSQALTRLEQSRSVFVKYGQPIDAALCDLTRGELHSAWREWEEADDYLQRARHTLYPGFPDQAWRADYALGKVALAQQNRKAALRHYLDAVDLITNLRAGLGLEQLSNDLFGARQQVFTDGLALAQNEGESAEALRVIEASKAQTLFTHLLHRDWRIQDPSDDDAEVADLVQRERELRYQLESLRRRVSLDAAYSEGKPLLRDGSVDVVPAETLGEINELSRAYESIVGRLRLARRGLSGVPSLAPFSIAPFREMAQARWGNRWAALDYYLAGDDLTIAYLDPDEVRIESVRLTGDDYSVLRRCAGTNPDLRALVYRGLGGDGASPVSARYLRHLADKLIPAKVRASTGERILIIAPHGPLHHLPFHALMEGDNYLVDRFDFLYTPSLQTLTQLDHDARGTGGLSRILLFGLDDFGSRARPLKHTAQEILAPQASGNGKVTALWEADATRRTILEWNESGELESFDLLHFATHAILEPDAPHWSRIMMADDDLTVLDVMDLKLDARLVILSACSSAVGAQGTGDELLGLARAFFYAGARALVASLWAVEDESTARLMRILYDNLKKGEPISVALRAAQLDMRRAGFAPFYWAPFVAIGSA